MAGFKYRMSGLNKVLKRIESYNKELADGVDQELNQAVINIANDAKSRAPLGKSGRLVGSIRADTSQRFNKSVTVGVDYGAYVEFGTGANVFESTFFNYDIEMREYARTFFVNGQGWLYPSPFLFPAYEAERFKVLQRIKKRLFKR